MGLKDVSGVSDGIPSGFRCIAGCSKGSQSPMKPGYSMEFQGLFMGGSGNLRGFHKRSMGFQRVSKASKGRF